jgi:hypothetical protein
LSPIQQGKGELRAQRGAGKIKALIVTAILIFGVYAGFKLVPPYSDTVFKTVQDLEIPATRENIKVNASTSKVAIVVDYTVPVDLLFYHVDLHFTPSSENKSLT